MYKLYQIGRNLSRVAPVLIGVTDAAVLAGGSLAVNVVCARSMTLTEYGIFASCTFVVLMSLGLSKAVHSDVWVFARLTQSGNLVKASESTGEMLKWCALLAVVAAFGWSLKLAGYLDNSSVESILATMTYLAGMLVLDHVRWLAFADDRSWIALSLDSLFVAGNLVGLLVVVDVVENVTPTVALLVAAAAALPLAVLALVLTPYGSFVFVRWYRREWQTLRNLLLDYVLLQSSSYGALLLIACIVPIADVGLLRKAQLALAPLNVVATGLMAALQPILLRQNVKSRRRMIGVAIKTGAFSAAVCLLYGMLVLFVPSATMEGLVGGGWREATNFLPGLTVLQAAGVLGGCAGLGLRAVSRLRVQVQVRWVLAPVSLGCVGVGAFLSGAEWAIILLALTTLVASGAWVVLLLQGLGQAGVRE